MLSIQKIIDKIEKIKYLKIKSFEIIFDELDEVISDLLDMKKEIEKSSDSDSDSDYSFNSNDIKALRHYVKHLKE